MQDNKDFFDDIKIPERLEPEKIAEMINYCKANNQFQNKNAIKTNNKKQDVEKITEEKQVEEVFQEETTDETIQENFCIAQEKNEEQAIQKKFDKPILSKKNKITRTIAAAVACALIVFGLTNIFQNDEVVYFNGNEYDFESEIAIANDYTQIFNTIQRVNSVYPYNSKDDDLNIENETDGNDFSATHQQTQGVNEADLMKTDGKYIYFVSNSMLNIIEAQNGDMKHLSSTSRSDDFIALEMFLYENIVVAIKEPKVKSGHGIVAEDDRKDSTDKANENTDITIVEIYDVTDKTNPSLKSSYTQKGRYNTSRMIEDKLYISTSYSIDVAVSNKDETHKYVPCYKIDGKENLILAKDINIAKECKTLNYAILGGIDVNATNPLISTKAVLGYDGVAYASMNNFYITGEKFDDDYNKTTVLRFSIKDGVIKHNGSGEVDGSVLNQFSMDEYNGYLRIATTTNNNSKLSNGIYILDGTLKQIGEVENIGANERIKSARFDENTGYIVTFMQTDPLYKIDLSNPKSPKILSEVKIDGYSKYLQEFGEDNLLGIGVNVDEKGVESNLKITMFSKGENGEQKEIASEIFGNEKASAYNGFDHKAYLVDVQKNLIGIPSMYFDGVDYCNEYYFYKFVENEFQQIGKYTMHSYDNNDMFLRGMYIGDYIYLFNRNSIIALDIKDLSKKSAIVF